MKQQKANYCVNSSNRHKDLAAVGRRRLKVAVLSPKVLCSSSRSRTSSKRGTTKVYRLSKRMALHITLLPALKTVTWLDSRGEHPAQLLIRIAHLLFTIMTETEPSARMILLRLSSSPTTWIRGQSKGSHKMPASKVGNSRRIQQPRPPLILRPKLALASNNRSYRSRKPQTKMSSQASLMMTISTTVIQRRRTLTTISTLNMCGSTELECASSATSGTPSS